MGTGRFVAFSSKESENPATDGLPQRGQSQKQGLVTGEALGRVWQKLFGPLEVPPLVERLGAFWLGG